MEYLSATILSGITYDLVRKGIQVSTSSLKAKLQNWLINDEDIEVLAQHINEIRDIEDLSESAISKKLEQDPIVQELIVNTNQENINSQISQINYGDGDNFGGDKVGGDKIGGDKIGGNKIINHKNH